MTKMFKECYEEVIKYNFDISKLGEIARKYQITVDMVIEYARSYYIYILGKSRDSFNELMEMSTVTDDTNETVKLDDFLKENPQLNGIYNEIGGNTYCEFESRLLKYCYEYCEGVWFDKKMIYDRAQELGLSYSKFRSYAKRYAVEVLGEDNFELTLIDDSSKQGGILSKWINYSSKRKRCYQEIGGNNYQEFRERLLKTTYDYAKIVGFNRNKIKSFGKIYDLSYGTILGYIRTYSFDYLGMSSSEYKEMIIERNEKGIDKRILAWISGNDNRKKTYEICGGNTFEEFRDNLYMMCYSYGEKVNFDACKLKEYSDRIGVTYNSLSSYISRYAHDKLNVSEREWKNKRNKKEYDSRLNAWLEASSKHVELYDRLLGGDYITLQNKLGRFFNQELEKNNYKYMSVLSLSLEYDESYERIINLLSKYSVNNPEISSKINNGIEKIRREKSNEAYKQKDGKISGVLKILENLDNEDEIRVLLSCENARALYGYVSDYVIVHYRDMDTGSKDKIINDLRGKILRYLRNNKESSLKQNNRNEEDKKYLEVARIVILEFIDSSEYDKIKDFCIDKSIKITFFEEMVDIVKKYDLELYSKYLSKIERLRNKGYAVLLEKINLILNGIKYGIIEGNEKRQFDLLDYYSITRLPLENTLRIARNYMNNSDIRILSQFINKYKKNNGVSVRELLNTKIIINNREVTDDMKREVIDYLNDNKLPVNSYMFSLVLRRLMNGKYTLVEGKKLILSEKETYKRK